MQARPQRPPFDPELEAEILGALGGQAPELTAAMIPTMRRDTTFDVTDEVLSALNVKRRDVTIESFGGGEIVMSILTRDGHSAPGPGIFHTHGGGMISGTQMTGIQPLLPWIVEHDAVVVSVNYRLAPEFPDPFPVEDCYAGLVWMAKHAAALDIDEHRLMIAGASAGGGLAAGTALLARDRSFPALIGQMLICPMLDDRDQTISSAQFEGVGPWDRQSNAVGWTALLGDRRGTDDVSIYAAPARASDLAGLPSTYIDCGSAEVFRDENVAYATALLQAGVQVELHVWPGGFHGFHLFAPDAKLSKLAAAARGSWIARLLGD